jgi:hypothetical protein
VEIFGPFGVAQPMAVLVCCLAVAAYGVSSKRKWCNRFSLLFLANGGLGRRAVPLVAVGSFLFSAAAVLSGS